MAPTIPPPLFFSSRSRMNKNSLQLQGKMTVSANLRDSPQNFHKQCAEHCQQPGSQTSLLLAPPLFFCPTAHERRSRRRISPRSTGSSRAWALKASRFSCTVVCLYYCCYHVVVVSTATTTTTTTSTTTTTTTTTTQIKTVTIIILLIMFQRGFLHAP